MRLRAFAVSVLALGACSPSPDTPQERASEQSDVVELSSPLQPTSADSAALPAGPTAGADQQAETGAADPVAGALDSLRAEVTRLTASVDALQRSADRGPDAELTSADSPQDTATEGIPGIDVRETAREARNLGLRIFWAFVILLLAGLLVRVSVWLLETTAERQAARRLLFKKLIPIARLLIWTLAAYYVVAGVFNVDRAGLVAATAALGVGIGFAAQGVLKNFIGGLIIIFDQPFQVGDKIRVGGTYGEVVSIGMRSTRIVTPDDNLVTVPNSQIVEEQVANANAGALDCQVVVDLYLPGWVDVTEAKSIAHSAATNSKYVYLDKPIVVNVKDEFKETFLIHLVVKAYVLDARYEFAFASDVTEAAKIEFLRHGMLWPMAGQRADFEPRDATEAGATSP
jgi:small-conductance mechanosensitive channel